MLSPFSVRDGTRELSGLLLAANVLLHYPADEETFIYALHDRMQVFHRFGVVRHLVKSSAHSLAVVGSDKLRLYRCFS